MRMSFSLSLALALLGLSALAQDPDSPDSKQRAKAAREMAKQGSDAAPKLAKLVSDPVLDVRVEAVKSLVEIGTQHSLSPLILAANDKDPEIQIRAVDGLVNFYVPGYLKSGGLSNSLKRTGSGLKVKFSDPSDQEIAPYVEARPEVLAAVAKLIGSGANLDARAAAARATGVLRARAALPVLYEALRSKNDRLMYESLIALQKIRDPAAGPHVTFLLRDLDEKIQAAAIETIGLLRTQSAIPQLRDVLSEGRSVKVSRAALTALAQMPDDTARQFFVRNVNDKDDGMRAAALEGLGRLKSPADRSLAENAFATERKMNAHLAAAFALVKFGRTEMSEESPLGFLFKTLDSSAWRGVSAGFLLELARDPAIRLAIYPAIPGASKSARTEIARILARSGDTDSVPVLENLSRDADSAVAEEALRALRSVKARRAQ